MTHAARNRANGAGAGGMNPDLSTARLRLRAPILADFEHRAAFHASDRAVWEGGPLTRARARRAVASDAGPWPLAGYGPFGAEKDGTCLGDVGIHRTARPARAFSGRERQVIGRHPGNTRSVAPGPRFCGRICDRPRTAPYVGIIGHDLRGIA